MDAELWHHHGLMAVLVVNLLLIALVGLPQAASGVASGAIIGRVVDAGTGDPISGARVTLNRAPAVSTTPPSSRPSGPSARSNQPVLQDSTALRSMMVSPAETTADGTFEIRNVPPGRWLIRAQKQGYVIPGPPLALPSFEVIPGRSITIPEIRLDRGGVITGRILDARGNPISDVGVAAVQMRRTADGRVLVTGGSPTVPTNDLGEYRLAGLSPGEHYVMAQTRPLPPPTSPIAPRAATPARVTYVPTFYPGFVNEAVASPVTVARGATTGAIDFSLVAVPAFQVSGIVVDASGRPVASAIVRLAQQQVPFAASLFGGPSQADGSFRVVNVPAGVFAVMAAVPVVMRNGTSTSTSLNFGAAAKPGVAPVVSIDGDVGNLRVPINER